MNVIKVNTMNDPCKVCSYYPHDKAAYEVAINSITFTLCEECKHELTFELISN